MALTMITILALLGKLDAVPVRTPGYGTVCPTGFFPNYFGGCVTCSLCNTCITSTYCLQCTSNADFISQGVCGALRDLIIVGIHVLLAQHCALHVAQAQLAQHASAMRI